MSIFSGFVRADKSPNRQPKTAPAAPTAFSEPHRRAASWIAPSAESAAIDLRSIWLDRLEVFLTRNDLPADWRAMTERARAILATPVGLDLARGGWADVDVVGCDVIKPREPRPIGLLFSAPTAISWQVIGDEIEVVEPALTGAPVRSRMRRPGVIAGVSPIWAAPVPKPKAVAATDQWHTTAIGSFRGVAGGGSEFWREGAPTRTLSPSETLELMQVMVKIHQAGNGPT